MSAESLAELRKWYAEHRDTLECKLAAKHIGIMLPGVAEVLRAQAPGDTAEEKELALLFAMTQIAEKLETHALLLHGIQVEQMTGVIEKAGQHDEAQKKVMNLLEEREVQEHALDVARRERDIAIADAARHLNENRALQSKLEEVETKARELQNRVPTQPEELAVSHVDVTPLASVREQVDQHVSKAEPVEVTVPDGAKWLDHDSESPAPAAEDETLEELLAKK